MNALRRLFHHILATDDGVSTTEYAVMLAMIILVAVGAIVNAGQMHRAFWLDSAAKLDTMTQASASF